MKMMMKGFVMAAVVAACFAGTAQARPINSQSVKYLDEAGNYVGQQYLLCDGRSGHGGNIHTAYKVEETVVCNSNGADPGWIVPNTIVTAYTLPGNISITAACNTVDCEGQYVPEVSIHPHGWTYTTGWQ
ncbi:MAG: hypothetical protein GAK28_03022 [Luteibacter sp.]|uniref:hypothetical protein n=1 Tax=Luteibacter sp. TaxID=1886636 RepID=UPI0013845585|nr:hypothetical protein [Luteibacter sp.]KAF1005801.1 MAG: hypothetical protein GAK28_03022 [Luteibacter sp.]